MANNTEEELLQALQDIQNTIIDNIGIGEREKIQEKNSVHEFEGIQEQLKKDYEWIKQQIQNNKEPENPEYILGNYRDRNYRKQRIDYDIL